MKKIFGPLLWLAVFTLCGVVLADSWSGPVVRDNGARLRGKAAVGLESSAGDVGALTVKRFADVDLVDGDLVVYSANIAFAGGFSVSKTTAINIAMTVCAGVMITPPSGPTTVTAGSMADIAECGDVKVKCVPLSVVKGDLLGSCGLAGYVSGTTGYAGYYDAQGTGMTFTVHTDLLQALETKTCRSYDPYIRARILH